MQRSISLSPQQKKELLAGRHYYLTKLREVLQQREALLATLEVSTSHMHADHAFGWLSTVIIKKAITVTLTKSFPAEEGMCRPSLCL